MQIFHYVKTEKSINAIGIFGMQTYKKPPNKGEKV